MRLAAIAEGLAWATPGRLAPCVFLLLLSTGGVMAAVAQEPTATIEVTATVADVAVFQAIPDSAAPGVARTDAGLWQIATGRSNEVTILLEPDGPLGAWPPRMMVCSRARETRLACRSRSLPRREACGPNRMVLLAPLEPASGGSGLVRPTPVHITMAYTAN